MAETAADELKRDILIVDDSPMSLRLLTHMITMGGYHAHSMTSAPEALAFALSSPPDLVLLDIMMPDMDGFELAEHLQADERTRDIPIIFISALNDEKSKVKAFTAGGVDYVSKPLHVNEVIARVGTHIRVRDASQRLQRQLTEREALIAELDAVNDQLKQEIVERESAQKAREASLKLLQRALAKTEALYRITRSLITTEDIPDMLQTVSESLAQALPADHVVTITLDMDAGEVTSISTGGPGADPLVDFTYQELMEGLTGWVVERVQPVISPKGQPDPRESDRVQKRREEALCGSMLVVPLYYQGRMMGTMTAVGGPDDPDFDEQDLAQLNAIAGQTSVALANARLSDETAYLKEFNEGIVQGVAEAILLTDDAQRITFANPAAVAMLGYAPERLIGQPCEMLFPPDQHDASSGASLACANGTAARFETVLQSEDGQRVPVLASIRPIYQEDRVTGSLAALTDITEIKQAEERLRQYAADLEAQNAELGAFAHTVAHDLRSPLTGIIGFADLLEGAVADSEGADALEYVQYLQRNSAKMNNIIDELLLLASVREVDEVNVRPLNMAKIVREAQSRLDFLIDEYDAHVTVPSVWPQAIGYGAWVEEVWVNYLSNAVKYGGRPDASVPPAIVLGADESTVDGHIRFWVRDNGLGLTPEQTGQLFTPFERLHNVRAEGHGLGLSIVRRILEKLGGDVGVESLPGEGSTFYFTLPRA